MKTAIILGGKSWIALAIARAFAEEGMNIVLVARSVSVLEADKSDIEVRFQVTVRLVELDASDTAALTEFVDSFADDAPEVVVSVLGRQEEEGRRRDDIDYIEGLVAGNLTVPAHVLERFATLMEPRGSGTLIGISSVAGDRGRQKNYTYGAAKAGFSAFLSGLRNRFAGTDIHVISVKPGVIETPGTLAMDHPGPLVGKAETVGADVVKAWRKRRNVIYTPWFWRWIMLIIRLIPEPVFKRLNL